MLRAAKTFDNGTITNQLNIAVLNLQRRHNLDDEDDIEPQKKLEQWLKTPEKWLKASEQWPTAPKIEQKFSLIDPNVSKCFPAQWEILARPRRVVLVAPFVIAHWAFNGKELTTDERLEVRKLKAFDNEWFQAAYAIALTLYFAPGNKS